MSFVSGLKRAAAVLLAACVIGNMPLCARPVAASTSQAGDVAADNIVVDGSFNAIHMEAGGTETLKIPVKAELYPALKPTIDVDTGSDYIHVIGTPTVVNSTGNRVSYISTGEHCYVTFKVKLSENTPVGTYNKFTITIGSRNKAGRYTRQVLELTSLRVIVDMSKDIADFDISNIEIPSSVKPGEKFRLKFTVSNRGALAAKNVTVQLSGFDSNFYTEGTASKRLGTLQGGETRGLSFDFTVNEKISATANVPITITVKSPGNGTENSAIENTFNVYTKIAVPEGLYNPLIEITNISAPRNVASGDNVTVSVTYTNTSKFDAIDFTADVSGFDAAGLIPATSLMKKRYRSFPAGKSVTLTYSFTVTDTAGEGIRRIAANWSYFAKTDTAEAVKLPDTQNIYMNVEPSDTEGLMNSVPKLMVSHYSTGKDKVMAGKVFDFTFTVKNTNKSSDAQNIQATISSDDNTFAITEGSASFMLDTIKPGKSKKLTVPLRVKGDVATNGYDLKITFDYEYKAIDPAIGNGKTPVSKSANSVTTLKLQVYSNDRPQVSNIAVGGGETPTFGESTELAFDFNNMGKSPLYNVTAKVSGDFTPAGDMLIIGKVDPGTGKNWTIDVTPNVEYHDSGVLTISYEDSNGNVTSYDTPFEADVMDAAPDIPASQLYPDTPVEEKKGVPIWAFILIEILVFLIAMLITRKVYIKRYKKKMRAKLEEEDEDL